MEKFADLRGGGRSLALELMAYAERPGVVALGIVRAGTPVAVEVSKRLGVPLDVSILRRLYASRERAGEYVCAASVAGKLVIDEEATLADAPASPLEHFTAEALAHLARRERDCRAGRAPLELSGKTVLLVDCGVHTGSTMRASLRALRRLGPARVVAAFPVASPEGLASVRPLADETVCLAAPADFGHTGLWYKDFARPDDDGTPAMLNEVNSEW